MAFFYLSLFLFLTASTEAVVRVILPDADRTYLIEMLTQTHKDISADRAQELVYELENFYTGVRDNLWAECGPPYEIDKVFHLHIINTRMYEAFSEANFGRFLHHSPFWSAHPPPYDLQTRCGDQVKKLQDHGVSVTYDYLWAPPTCGNDKEDLLTNKHREVWACDL